MSLLQELYRLLWLWQGAPLSGCGVRASRCGGLSGCAALATVLMLLLFVVGFPDLSAYSDADVSATLLGYWLPLIAAATATGCSVQRLL